MAQRGDGVMQRVAVRQVHSRYSTDSCPSAHYLPSERSACAGVAPTAEPQPDLSGSVCSAQPEVISKERGATLHCGYNALQLVVLSCDHARTPSRRQHSARTGQTYIGAACARAAALSTRH